MVCYLSSSENVHIQVKLFAVKKAGGMSYTKICGAPSVAAQF